MQEAVERSKTLSSVFAIGGLLLVAMLLLQRRLVRANIAVRDVQTLVDDPDLVADLLQKSEIVGNHHDASVESLDRLQQFKG